MSDDLTTWLRRQVEADLSRWRDLAAAYLPNVEREGEVLYFEAREHAAQYEAALRLLDIHAPVPAGYRGDGLIAGEYGCHACHVHEQGTDPEWPCITVRLLASGYCHRIGYREEWKP